MTELETLDAYPLDEEAGKQAKERWDSIAKPLGSLGEFEDMIVKLAKIQHTKNVHLENRRVVVMCADNGVVCEGVSQSDSSVTAVCAEDIQNGRSNVNALAGAFNAQVSTVNIGMCGEAPNVPIFASSLPRGTGNIAAGAAMSRRDAERAAEAGIVIAKTHIKTSARYPADIIVTGEMGIGNTTTSAAVVSVLLGVPPREITGRGAGLDSAGLERKISAIERAIRINKPDPNDPIDVLSKVGGLDIAGMTGLFLGGMKYGAPVVIDGAVSAVAALLAYRTDPRVKDFMLASHTSAEPLAKYVFDELGLKPVINAGMRLGEGTGGVMLLPLLDGALAVYKNAHTFIETNIAQYTEKI